MTLDEYFRLVKWYLHFNSASKKSLHENGYESAKRLFNLNTALIQTARDKAVEILRSFRGNRKNNGSVLRLKRISIRFDQRCYTFSKTTNVLTPYWLTLSLSRRKRITYLSSSGRGKSGESRRLLEVSGGSQRLRWSNEMVNGMPTSS